MFLVLEEQFGRAADPARDEARDDATNDGDAKRGAQTSELVETLLAKGSVASSHFGENGFKSGNVRESLVGKRGGDAAGKGTEDAWNSMEVVHTAGVMKADSSAERLGQIGEA